MKDLVKTQERILVCLSVETVKRYRSEKFVS